MNARQAGHIRYGIKYARDAQTLFAVFGPQAQLETLRQFKPASDSHPTEKADEHALVERLSRPEIPAEDVEEGTRANATDTQTTEAEEPSMTDGPLFRSDDDVAEAIAIQHGDSIRDRIDPAVQERINAMFEIGRD